MIERHTIRFRYPQLSRLEHPAFQAVGATDGPRLTLIGGVHGCEYSSIAAVTQFMNALDTGELSGRITAVPVVNLESFRKRSPFVVPVDGKNLNRCFPGDQNGSFTDVLAHAIFEELIAPADVLVDLHGGDLVEALEPFAIYDESEVEARARELAVAFGLPYVVREPRNGGLGGMTSSAAAQAGIPAIIAEAGGRGQLERSAVQMLVDGVGNVLRHLGMLPGGRVPPRVAKSVGRSIWIHCENQGWWQAAVSAGNQVRKGELLGRIHDLWGDALEEVNAPEDGVVLFLTTSPAVEADGLLLGLGTELAPVA
jgi:predicted deacylase